MPIDNATWYDDDELWRNFIVFGFILNIIAVAIYIILTLVSYLE